MRLAFFVLLLLNVAFFGYAQLLRGSDGAAERIARLQMNPGTITIVPQPGRARVSGAPGEAVACLEWGAFPAAEAARAEASIAALQLPGLAIQRVAADLPGYWVFVPPVKTRAEADRRVALLKSRGVQDLHVVQDGGPSNHAISLGIFKSEEAARSYADKLKGTGVANVAVERRDQMLKQVVFLVREPDTVLVSRLAELQRQFPGTDVKAVRCPAAAGQTG